MPIKFKIIQRSQPGVAGGGERLYYPSPVPGGIMTLDEMIKEIGSICTVSGPDIVAVIYAMVDVSVRELSNGTIVRLGDLGSLRISLSVEGRANEAEVNASCIKNASVLYTAGSRIKRMLKFVKFRKA